MRLALPLATLLAVGCRAPDAIEARFQSRAIEAVAREIRVFVFSNDPPSCVDLDPRGLPPGDAEVRSGRKAALSFVGPPEDEIFAELGDVAVGRTAIVIEAWGPPCAEVGGSADEPVCNRLATAGEPVLRGYWCNVVDLSFARRLDLVADLETFAQIGSSLSVPTNFPSNAVHYDEDDPLFVTDELPGRDRFTVQVLNHLAEAVDGVPVRFEVTSGAATLAEDQPVMTAPDPIIQDSGLASAFVRAESSASQGATIVVTAHAAGYDGSPIRFVARAVPKVETRIEALPLARGLIDFGGTDEDNHPLLLDDFDGDGLLDLATIAGYSQHRVVLAYARPGGTFAVHVSDPLFGQARAMTTAFLAPGRKSLVIAVSDSADLRDVPGVGQTYVIQNPRLEVHDLGTEPASETFAATPAVIGTEDGAPMEKVAFGIDAADIDRDGIDELALSRCSYVFWVNSIQYAKVECTARLSDHTDSELALLRVTPGDPPAFDVAATILSEGNDGGFRDVRLIDVDGDGSLDLVAAASSTAIGVCGRAGLPQSGFGFNDNPRFFSTITFGQGWSLASGRFNDDDFEDLVVTGGVRSSSPDSGMQLVAGGPCSLDVATEPVIVGAKSLPRRLVVRTADLNRDGWSDAVLLHRNDRRLQIYLGGGNYGLARGPSLDLPFGSISEMDLGAQGEDPIAAFVAVDENALVLVRFSP